MKAAIILIGSLFLSFAGIMLGAVLYSTCLRVIAKYSPDVFLEIINQMMLDVEQ